MTAVSFLSLHIDAWVSCKGSWCIYSFDACLLPSRWHGFPSLGFCQTSLSNPLAGLTDSYRFYFSLLWHHCGFCAHHSLINCGSKGQVPVTVTKRTAFPPKRAERMYQSSWVWWHMPIIPAPRGWRPEISSSRLSLGTWRVWDYPGPHETLSKKKNTPSYLLGSEVEYKL